MQNILQIVKFFKVEKIHSLIFQTEEPTATVQERATYLTDQEGSAGGRGTSQARASSKPYSDEHGSEEEHNQDRSEYHLEKIQVMLNELKACLDLPVNFKPRIQEAAPSRTTSRLQGSKIHKNEEYYLEHCSTELISALLKVIVEGLIRTRSVSSVETIPFSISRLLYLASNRSDQPVEREIFEQFFLESNKIMIDEIHHFRDKVETFEKIQSLVPGLSGLSGAKKQKEPVPQLNYITDHELINIRDVEEDSQVTSSPTKSQGEPKSATHKKPLTMMQQTALLQQQKQ